MVEDIYDLGVERIKLIFAGEPNSGKSHTAAMFVKEFGGLHVDFGKPIQVSTPSSVPNYFDDPKGHAITPCKRVGLTKDQYKFINKWGDFQFILDNIDGFIDTVKKVDDHIPWIIIDDTDGIRGLGAYQCSLTNGHKMPNQSDYREFTGKIKIIMGTLERYFNIITCTQMTDEYKNDVSTGIRIPYYYPSNAKHLSSAALDFDYVEEDGKLRPRHKVASVKDIWVCNSNVPTEIKYTDPLKISPKEMLEQLQFDKDQW